MKKLIGAGLVMSMILMSQMASADLMPHAGVLKCLGGDAFVLTQGVTVDGQTQNAPLSITCTELKSNQKHEMVITGVGVGALLSIDAFSINYAGFGELNSPIAYTGVRVDAAALLGADLGIFTNGTMLLTITGLDAGLGASVSIGSIQVQN